MAGFTFDTGTAQYHNDAGEGIPEQFVLDLHDQFVSAVSGEMRKAADQFNSGNLTSAEFSKMMQGIIKKQALDSYALGRGGFAAMTSRDYGIVGRYLRDQYAYLRKFAADAEELGAGMVSHRAGLYSNAGRNLFERARGAARGIWKLPATPGQGSECAMGCQCYWLYVQVLNGWNLFWIRTAKESCPTCVERSQKFAPYEVRV